MKFAEHLSAHITPEWRKQYITYEELKTLLYTAVEEMPSADYVDLEEVERHVAQFDDYFFRQCDGELKKINNFFAEKLAEAVRKFTSLKREVDKSERPPVRKVAFNTGSKFDLNGKTQLPPRKLQDLKLAFTEFYLSLILLQNYQNLNFTGFRKILKKHDKLLKENNGAEWRRKFVETTPFYNNKEIETLISETEQTFTNYLEGGDRQKAMKRLRVPPLVDHSNPWLTFKVGLFAGFFIVLLFAVILAASLYERRDQLKIALHLYRGSFLILEFVFLIGVNVYGWRSSGVNHVLIFELDPRNHLSEQHIFELASLLGTSWTISILCFLYNHFISIPTYLSPLLLILIIGFFIVFPVKTFHYEARYWLVRVIVRMFCAPFFYVGFADFWLADQLNSMVTVLTDFHYLICFYLANDNFIWDGVVDTEFKEYEVSRIIVNCIPAWIRFAQCLRRYRDTKEAFPHLANAGKYLSSIVATISLALFNSSKGSYANFYVNHYFYLYFVTTMVSSIYAYTWDVKMDWGLFDSSKPDSKYLREEMVYSKTIYYYFAIIEDLILRFIWIATFFITESGKINSDIVTSVVAPLEVFRRFVWNYFRLENEHLNNCGKFRAVRDISIAPIDAADPNIIIRMMDEEDGVVNRKKRKSSTKKLTKDDRHPLLTSKNE